MTDAIEILKAKIKHSEKLAREAILFHRNPTSQRIHLDAAQAARDELKSIKGKLKDAICRHD